MTATPPQSGHQPVESALTHARRSSTKPARTRHHPNPDPEVAA